MGLKILFTGALVALIGVFLAKLTPDDLTKLPTWYQVFIVIMFFAGVLSIIAGSLVAIWS